MKGVEQIFGNIIKIDICLWKGERERYGCVEMKRVHSVIFQSTQNRKSERTFEKKGEWERNAITKRFTFSRLHKHFVFGCCDSCTRSHKTCIFPVAFRPNALPLSIDCLNDYCIDSKLYRKLNAMNRETY